MKKITKKVLEKLYLKQKNSIYQIAVILNTNKSRIFRLIHEYNIPTRKIGGDNHWKRQLCYQELKKETNLKRTKTMKRKLASGELAPWNKNLTVETDKRVARNEKKRRASRVYTKGPQGWNHTEEFKKRQSLNHGGTGIPRENTEYGPDFTNALKEAVRFRDKCKCQLCGCPQIENGRKLDVHHIDYNKLNNILKNLIALCKKCHTKTNVNRDYWFAYFMQLISNKI